MKAKKVDDALDQMQNAMQKLYKIVDKLEQRIASLEKVLESHAKCIGEIRASEIELNPDLRKKIVKRLGEFHDCR
jgi:exonuclease VII small subunit